MDVYKYFLFFWIPYWPRMLINILWHPLGANKDGGPIWELDLFLAVEQRTVGLSCTKPITTKQQFVFWLITAYVCHIYTGYIYVGTCRRL